MNNLTKKEISILKKISVKTTSAIIIDFHQERKEKETRGENPDSVDLMGIANYRLNQLANAGMPKALAKELIYTGLEVFTGIERT